MAWSTCVAPRSDYDRWAEAGCSGWDWQSVRAAFEELEEWLRPAVLHPHNALTEAMVEAAIQAGFPYNPSFDSGTLDGVGWNKSTIADGERFNAYRAFVAPVLDRPNLHLADRRPGAAARDGRRPRPGRGRPTRRWLAGDDSARER